MTITITAYGALLAPLGYRPGSRGTDYAGFGPKDKPALWLHAAKKGGGAHLALTAPDRAAVDAFHKGGINAGGIDNGKPGLRPDYGAAYYAAFVLDADGNNVEAVCLVP